MTGETLYGALEAVAAEHGDAPALVISDAAHHEAVTFAEISDGATHVAAALAAAGFERGDRLGVWLPNLPEWLILQFAASRLGVALVSINTRYRSEELLHLLTLSRPRGLAFAPGFLDIDFAGIVDEVLERTAHGALELLIPVRASLAEEPEGVRVATFEALADAGESLPAPASGDGSDLTILFPTSGTTSLPKLASHDQTSVVVHSRNAARGLDVNPGDRMLCPLPLCGVYGYNAILAPLLTGATVLSQAVFDGPRAAALGDAHAATHFIGTEPMLGALLEAGRPKTLRRGICSVLGDHPQRWMDAAERELGVRLGDVYGSSEGFALLAFWPPEAPVEQRILKGGRPASPDIEIRIVDTATGDVLPPGEQGEIHFRGYNVLRGYLDNPEATAKALTPDGWYRTGDLGYLDDDGNLAFLSRLDDSLRLHGFLVNPGEIEHLMEGHPAVAAAQVVGVKDASGADSPVAFVVKAADCDPDELIAYCRQRAASYKAPQHIVFVDDYPRTVGTNGAKVQRNVLRERARSLFEQ